MIWLRFVRPGSSAHAGSVLSTGCYERACAQLSQTPTLTACPKLRRSIRWFRLVTLSLMTRSNRSSPATSATVSGAWTLATGSALRSPHAGSTRRRRARKLDAPQGDPRLTREYLLLIKDDPCVYCGAPGEDNDHIVSLVNGGAEAWDNFARTCRSCNTSKHDKHLLTCMLNRVRMGSGGPRAGGVPHGRTRKETRRA